MQDADITIIQCGGSEEAGKRLVAVLLSREQLLYDIRNNCYIEGHILRESDDETRHTIQDVGEEGNVDRVTRVLDLTHADITERLYPFTQRDIRHPVVDDRLRERPAYGIFLSVPESYSQTTLNLLGKLIHELMVCTATADWMSITNAPKEDHWRRKAETTLTRINEVKSQTRGRIRIRPHWV